MPKPMALAALLVLSAACGGSGREAGSTAPPLAVASTSSATVPSSIKPGPELDAETARRLNLGSIGPDLATVPAVEGATGQPVTPFDLTARTRTARAPPSSSRPTACPMGWRSSPTATAPPTSRARSGGAGSYLFTHRVTDDTGASDVSVATFEVRS